MITRIVRLVAAGALLAAATVAAPVTASAGGGCHGDIGAVHGDGTTSVVRMDICTFEPTVARVAVGTEVRFLNTAVLQHVVTGERQSWGTEGKALDPGDEYRHRFDEAGIFPYSCPLHPGMVGAIVVGDAAPAAVAPAGGTSDTPGSEATGTSEVAVAATEPGWVLPAVVVAVGLGGVIGGLWLARLVAARRRALA
jgi:plastocyanin